MDATPSYREPAKFVQISELLSSVDTANDLCILNQRIVRTIGKMHKYNVQGSRIWIQDCGTLSLLLAIDSSNIEPFPFKENTLCQFIGEVNWDSANGLYVKALLYRYVEGLHMNTYLTAHDTRMKELSKTAFSDW